MPTYDQHFYDVIREGAQASVKAAMPHLHNQLDITPDDWIIDVGCGEGWWADGFAQLGCTVYGLDTGTTGQRPDSFTFVEHDLLEPLPPFTDENDDKLFDIAVSLEVAEHLPEHRAASFVAELCALADLVVFSAARPGQGGTGHINEQPIGYWAELFKQNDYAVSGAMRWFLWSSPAVENWYKANMLVAARRDPDPAARGYQLFYPSLPMPMVTPHDVVHPILFDARRQR